jgi:uncharacterized protein YidB (DUF937 family)
MSSNGFPSMTALLGLVAMAGFQNRDKLAEIFGGRGQSPSGGAGQSGLGGLLGRVTSSLGGASAGGSSAGGASAGGGLSGALGELVESFKQNGHGDAADSWIGTGPNKPVTPPQLEQAIGPDVLNSLTQQTGLSQEELLARLSRDLPKAVDRYTPQGRLPTEAESRS